MAIIDTIRAQHAIMTSAFIPTNIIKSGSPGVAVGANQGLPHQKGLEEFSPFFGHIGHESLFTHGFVML
jgi:hypothetical protein